MGVQFRGSCWPEFALGAWPPRRRPACCSSSSARLRGNVVVVSVVAWKAPGLIEHGDTVALHDARSPLLVTTVFPGRPACRARQCPRTRGNPLSFFRGHEFESPAEDYGSYWHVANARADVGVQASAATSQMQSVVASVSDNGARSRGDFSVVVVADVAPTHQPTRTPLPSRSVRTSVHTVPPRAEQLSSSGGRRSRHWDRGWLGQSRGKSPGYDVQRIRQHRSWAAPVSAVSPTGAPRKDDIRQRNCMSADR